jgi:hypothetical protein
VTLRFGPQPRFFSKRRSRRVAALASRRACRILLRT